MWGSTQAVGVGKLMRKPPTKDARAGASRQAKGRGFAER